MGAFHLHDHIRVSCLHSHGIIACETFDNGDGTSAMAQLSDAFDGFVGRQYAFLDSGAQKLAFGVKTPSPRLDLRHIRRFGDASVKSELSGKHVGLLIEFCRSQNEVVLIGPPHREQCTRTVDGSGMRWGSVVAASKSEREVVFRIEQMEFHNWIAVVGSV